MLKTENTYTFCTRLVPLHFVHSSHRVVSSQGLFTLSFSACVWGRLPAALDPHIFFAFPSFCFFRTTCNGICLLPPLRTVPLCFHFLVVHNDPFLSWLWLWLFAILPLLHQTVNTSCVLQSCMNLLSFLLDSARSYLRHNSSIHHHSFFCQLLCFLKAFSDESFEVRHVLQFLLGKLCFHVLDLHQ